MKTLIISSIAALLLCFNTSSAQYSKENPSKECFIGSTLFLLGNFAPTNKPDFAQLNFGYRLTEKDVVSIELKTWKYAWSLGIPYRNSFEAEEEQFPGYIREVGFAAAYQRFWWKGLYTGIHVMNAKQYFVDEERTVIKKGYQLFNTYRLGYHFKLFKESFFIEPSIAITHRAFHSEMPEKFKIKDDKWSKFFFGEPGMHFGFNF